MKMLDMLWKIEVGFSDGTEDYYIMTLSGRLIGVCLHDAEAKKIVKAHNDLVGELLSKVYIPVVAEPFLEGNK
jgi:hypothetical protein